MTLETAARLGALRRERGLSQEELAEKLGVSRQAVSKWERAESSPDTDNLITLAKLYGLSLDELLYGPGGDGEPFSPQPAAQGDAEPAAPQDAAEDAVSDALPQGSYYEHLAREKERRRRQFPYPVWVSAAYLVLGIFFDLWHPGWIIFLTIPLFYLPQSQRGYLQLLGNPIMVTIIYLLLGTLCNLWHPGWLVFLLIPLLNGGRLRT